MHIPKTAMRKVTALLFFCIFLSFLGIRYSEKEKNIVKYKDWIR